MLEFCFRSLNAFSSLTLDEADRVAYLQCFRKYKSYLAYKSGTVLKINLIYLSKPTNGRVARIWKRGGGLF